MTKQHPNRAVHYGLLTLIFGLAIVTLFTHTITHALSSKQQPSSAAHGTADEHVDTRHAHTSNDETSCTISGRMHYAIIQADTFNPSSLTINRCDTLQITNKDAAPRSIAIGDHDNHISYPGFNETALGKESTVSIQATTSGTFLVHDHFDDSVSMTLTIRQSD